MQTNPLKQLAAQLATAEEALREAAQACPGDVALQTGLLERAAWCREKHLNTLDRLAHGGLRRAGDQARRTL